MPNKGEKGEDLAIGECFMNKNNIDWCVATFGEAGEEGIEVIDPKTNKPIATKEDIQKASSLYKADIKLQLLKTGEYLAPSIKAINCAPPAVLNHTHRAAKAFQNELQVILPYLDEVLSYYKERRMIGACNEDVKLLDLLKNFHGQHGQEVRDAWVKTLVYFSFEGTGSKCSRCPANSMMMWDGSDVSFIDCRTQEQKENYIKDLLDQDLYKISLRNKAMPQTITETMLPWVYEDASEDVIKYKGALHIRLLKK